jgi:dienelactone hydrolase
MPDLLQPRQGTWPLKHYPPISVWKNRLADWYRKGPGCVEANREAVKNVLCALTSWGEPPGGQRSALATLGFGWGGYIALRCANAEAMAPAPVKAGAALYPELFGLDGKIAEDIGVPVAILPAKHGPMERTMLTLQETKPQLARHCLFKRAGKVPRGYATWAPVWDPKLAAHGWEFISYAVQFIEHAWEGKVFVPPDEKGYKMDLGEYEQQQQQQQQQDEQQEGAQQEQGQEDGTNGPHSEG